MFKFSFDLDCKVAIYVPSTINAVDACDNTPFVRRTLETLCNMFGGATSSAAVGGWMSPTHGLITESVTVVYAFCSSDDLAARFADIVNFCQSLKKDMAQEAILIEVNGQCKFI